MRKGVVGSIVIAAFVVTVGLTAVATERQLAAQDARVEQAWERMTSAYFDWGRLARQSLESTRVDQAAPEDLLLSRQAVASLRRTSRIASPDAMELASLGASRRTLDEVTARFSVAMKTEAQIPGEAYDDLIDSLAAKRREAEAARAVFNAETLAYNRLRRRFPTVLIALAAGFGDRPYFDEPKDTTSARDR
ncbi:MAG: LemA family protein [Myxococcota bacterium]